MTAAIVPRKLYLILATCCLLLGLTCWLYLLTSQPRVPAIPAIDPSQLNIKAWRTIDDFSQDIAQFDSVFWEPEDTTSLREWLSKSALLHDARVLEIGTGTGIVALFCGQYGAAQVVATDINPIAVANARYNAELFGLTHKVEVRQVPPSLPGPFSVIQPNEQFDLIISNPPWEDAGVEELAAHALFDPGFALLDGMLRDGARFLRPHGRLLLAYGARTAVRRILTTAPELGWHVQLIDTRDLEALPEVFLPGMLLELRHE